MSKFQDISTRAANRTEQLWERESSRRPVPAYRPARTTAASRRVAELDPFTCTCGTDHRCGVAGHAA